MDNDAPPPATPPATPSAAPPPLSSALPPFIPARPAPAPKKSSGWRAAAIVLGVLLVGSVGLHFLGLLDTMFDVSGAASSGSHMMEITVDNQHSGNKIAVIPVVGIIMGGGEPVSRSLVKNIEDQLKLAAKDRAVKAVILKVDSPGGTVLASDDIYNLIAKFQQKHNKPVVASMGSMAASGGYYVSAPCRWIVAHELTMTGSIGVIMQSYNFRGLMNKTGVRPVTIKSGKFKDMLSFSKELENLTREEKDALLEEEALLRKMITETYDKFKSVITQGRAAANASNASGSDPGRKLSSRWTDFADGRILSGKDAYDLGLVDELGGWETAVVRARTLAGIENADLVTYREPFNFGSLFSIFGRAEAKTVKVDLGIDLPQLRSGLYFLAPSLMH